MRTLIMQISILFTISYFPIKAQRFIQERNFTPIADHVNVKDVSWDLVNNRYFSIHDLISNRISLVGYNNTIGATIVSRLMSISNNSIVAVKVKSSGAFTYVLFFTILPSGLRTPGVAKIDNATYNLVYANQLIHGFNPKEQEPTDIDILNDEVYITGRVDNGGALLNDVFVLKLDVNGNKLFNRYYQVNAYDDIPNSIDVKGNDIIIGGVGSNPSSINDRYIFIHQLDLAGNTLSYVKQGFNPSDVSCINNRFTTFHLKRDQNMALFGVAKTYTNNKAACFLIAKFDPTGFAIITQNLVHPDFSSPSPFIANLHINSDFDFLENTSKLVISGTARPNQAFTPHSHVNLFFDKTTVGLPLSFAKLYLNDGAFVDNFMSTNNTDNTVVNATNKPGNNTYYRFYKSDKNGNNTCETPLTFGNCNCPLIKGIVSSTSINKVSTVVAISGFSYTNYNNTSTNVCYSPNLADSRISVSMLNEDEQLIITKHDDRLYLSSDNVIEKIVVTNVLGQVVKIETNTPGKQKLIELNSVINGLYTIHTWLKDSPVPISKKVLINK
jgi:hypothetical protein